MSSIDGICPKICLTPELRARGLDWRVESKQWLAIYGKHQGGDDEHGGGVSMSSPDPGVKRLGWNLASAISWGGVLI